MKKSAKRLKSDSTKPKSTDHALHGFIDRREFKTLRALDAELVHICKDIKILTALSWPQSVSEEFLSRWEKGQPKLPKVARPQADKEIVQLLKNYIKKVPGTHPWAVFLRKTADSYLSAARMLEQAGKAGFLKHSLEIYGGSDDVIGEEGETLLQLAQRCLAFTDAYSEATLSKEEDLCILPKFVQQEMQAAVDKVFVNHKVKVIVDSELVSKAAAGARRIRLRGHTCFSRLDTQQLLEHEAFVHTLTAINGRGQRYIKSLGLGAPRTTVTQEGLAVFAELITNAMDLHRLRRIALRVIAISKALDGADFIEVFQFFLRTGQNEFESFQSTMRIFRGGDVKGKIVFTKDLSYLRGVLKLHQYLLYSLRKKLFQHPRYLFAGRLDFSDTQLLSGLFESGLIRPPIYEPRWLQNQETLMAFLLCSALFQRANTITKPPA